MTKRVVVHHSFAEECAYEWDTFVFNVLWKGAIAVGALALAASVIHTVAPGVSNTMQQQYQESQARWEANQQRLAVERGEICYDQYGNNPHYCR